MCAILHSQQWFKIQEQTEGPTREESARASKALLSKTETVPRWLVDRFPIPEGGCIHHTQFRDTSLPLFQAKLHNGKIFEGQKQSCRFWFRDLCEGLSSSIPIKHEHSS